MFLSNNSLGDQLKISKVFRVSSLAIRLFHSLQELATVYKIHISDRCLLSDTIVGTMSHKTCIGEVDQANNIRPHKQLIFPKKPLEKYRKFKQNIFIISSPCYPPYQYTGRHQPLYFRLIFFHFYSRPGIDFNIELIIKLGRPRDYEKRNQI